jgi:DNA-binding Lrp family transcriptional regulator
MATQKAAAKRTTRRRKRRTKSADAVLAENQKILDYIRLHPQDSVGEIASEFKMSSDTMRKRLYKLEDLGSLQLRYEVNLDKLEFTNLYRMSIVVDHKALRETYKQQRKVKGKTGKRLPVQNPQERLAYQIMALNKTNPDVIVEDVAVLMGDQADLSATLRTRGDQNAIFNFVTAAVRPLPTIQSTATCIQAWSISQERRRKEAKQAELKAQRKQAIAARKRKATRLAKKLKEEREKLARDEKNNPTSSVPTSSVNDSQFKKNV